MSQFSSVAQSCLTLCNTMDCSMPGFPVHHQLLELAQIHVHRVSDAIQPSHPLSSPSPAFNLSQHQGLFQWVSSLHQVAKVLEFQLQHQYFQWIFRTDFLQDWLVWSPCSPRNSQESSPTAQFKSINYQLPVIRITVTSDCSPTLWVVNPEGLQKEEYLPYLTTLKPLTVWIKTSCGKFFKRWEYQTTLPASWEICM